MATLNRIEEALAATAKGPSLEQIEHADGIAVGHELHHIVEGAERYLASTAVLAKAEIASDARAIAAAGAKLLACGVALVLGYAFGCVALGLALAPALGAAWAFTAVAAANVLVGGAGLLATGNESRRALEKIGTRWRATASEIGESLRRLRDDALAPLNRNREERP